jgi:hypothetical protein
MVIPGPGFPTFGSLDDTIANRSPFGSHEKSRTVSECDHEFNLNEIFAHTQTFMFHDFDGEILVSDSEDLEVTEGGFLRLCVTIDLHAEEVALVLPVEFAL